MTKFLTLMNPSRFKKSETKVTRMATKTRPRARIARRASRPAPPKMTPAMRRKVSAGVRRYFAQRKARQAVSSRPATRAVARSVRYSAPVRRSSRRRVSSFSMPSSSPLKSLMSKDTLKIAGGAIGASFASDYVINKWGDKLPGMQSPYGQTAYRAAVPLGLAWLVRRWDSRIAQGMVIGAAIMVVNDLLRYFMTGSGRQFERLGLAGELNGFAAPPSPARLDAIRRAKPYGMHGFRGTVEQLASAPGSPAFSRQAF